VVKPHKACRDDKDKDTGPSAAFVCAEEHEHWVRGGFAVFKAIRRRVGKKAYVGGNNEEHLGAIDGRGVAITGPQPMRSKAKK